jgi:hypothetical protein
MMQLPTTHTPLPLLALTTLGTQGSQGKLGGHNHGTILLTVLLTNFANVDKA